MQKKFILKKNWEFNNIINLKQQIISPTLVLYFKKSNNFKIGISIPKKFANAVNRNYLKRQVKAILDYLQPFYYNYEIVLIVRKQFLKLRYNLKLIEVSKMLERIARGEQKIK